MQELISFILSFKPVIILILTYISGSLVGSFTMLLIELKILKR